MTTHPTTEDAERLIAAAPCPSGWRPIETAPKDGTQVLVFSGHSEDTRGNGSGIYIAGWSDDPLGGDFYEFIDSPSPLEPSHWQPRPAAPIPDGGPA